MQACKTISFNIMINKYKEMPMKVYYQQNLNTSVQDTKRHPFTLFFDPIAQLILEVY